MGYESFIYQIDRIDQLIRLRATGTPQELVQISGASIRTTYSFTTNLTNLQSGSYNITTFTNGSTDYYLCGPIGFTTPDFVLQAN